MKRQFGEIKPHIYTIYANIGKFMFVIIIPFLQQILFSPATVAEKTAVAVFNAATTAVITVVAVTRYKALHFVERENGILYTKGIFLRRHIFIENKSLNSLYIISGFLMQLFKVKRVMVTTQCKSDRNDISVYTSAKSAAVIASRFLSNGETLLYKANFINVMLMAITRSDFVTGILAAAPFIKETSAILGKEYGSKIYTESMGIGEFFVMFGLPPALAYLAAVMAAGYTAAIAAWLLASVNFSLSFDGTSLHIKRGILPKGEYILPVKNISAVTVKQNMLMLAFGRCTLYAVTVRRQGRKQGDSSLLVPDIKVTDAVKLLHVFYPAGEKYLLKSTPHRGAIKSYLYLPCTALAVVFILYGIVANFTDSGILTVFMLFFAPLCVIWIFFRIWVFSLCGVYKNQKLLKLCSYSGFSLCTTLVKTKDTSCTFFQKSLWQQVFSSRCSFGIYLKTCTDKKVTVKQLKADCHRLL